MPCKSVKDSRGLVWSSHRERYTHQGNVFWLESAWAHVSVTGKMRLVITNGWLHGGRYRDDSAPSEVNTHTRTMTRIWEWRLCDQNCQSVFIIQTSVVHQTRRCGAMVGQWWDRGYESCKPETWVFQTWCSEGTGFSVKLQQSNELPNANVLKFRCKEAGSYRWALRFTCLTLTWPLCCTDPPRSKLESLGWKSHFMFLESQNHLSCDISDFLNTTWTYLLWN